MSLVKAYGIPIQANRVHIVAAGAIHPLLMLLTHGSTETKTLAGCALEGLMKNNHDNATAVHAAKIEADMTDEKRPVTELAESIFEALVVREHLHDQRVAALEGIAEADTTTRGARESIDGNDEQLASLQQKTVSELARLQADLDQKEIELRRGKDKLGATRGLMGDAIARVRELQKQLASLSNTSVGEAGEADAGGGNDRVGVRAGKVGETGGENEAGSTGNEKILLQQLRDAEEKKKLVEVRYFDSKNELAVQARVTADSKMDVAMMERLLQHQEMMQAQMNANFERMERNQMAMLRELHAVNDKLGPKLMKLMGTFATGQKQCFSLFALVPSRVPWYKCCLVNQLRLVPVCAYSLEPAFPDPELSPFLITNPSVWAKEHPRLLWCSAMLLRVAAKVLLSKGLASASVGWLTELAEGSAQATTAANMAQAALNQLQTRNDYNVMYGETLLQGYIDEGVSQLTANETGVPDATAAAFQETTSEERENMVVWLQQQHVNWRAVCGLRLEFSEETGEQAWVLPRFAAAFKVNGLQTERSKDKEITAANEECLREEQRQRQARLEEEQCQREEEWQKQMYDVEQSKDVRKQAALAALSEAQQERSKAEMEATAIKMQVEGLEKAAAQAQEQTEAREREVAKLEEARAMRVKHAEIVAAKAKLAQSQAEAELALLTQQLLQQKEEVEAALDSLRTATDMQVAVATVEEQMKIQQQQNKMSQQAARSARLQAGFAVQELGEATGSGGEIFGQLKRAMAELGKAAMRTVLVKQSEEINDASVAEAEATLCKAKETAQELQASFVSNESSKGSLPAIMRAADAERRVAYLQESVQHVQAELQRLAQEKQAIVAQATQAMEKAKSTVPAALTTKAEDNAQLIAMKMKAVLASKVSIRQMEQRKQEEIEEVNAKRMGAKMWQQEVQRIRESKLPEAEARLFQAADRATAAEADKERVQHVAAKGDVTITLMWQKNCDLDLHCITPDGTRIFYGSEYRKDKNNRKTKCGGQLDLDMTKLPPDGQAIENIYWTDNAPTGRYKVSVVNYSKTHKCSFDLIVCGGLEGKSGRQAVRSWRDQTIGTNTKEASLMEGKPELLVCEFDYVSSSEPLKWQFAVK